MVVSCMYERTIDVCVMGCQIVNFFCPFLLKYLRVVIGVLHNFIDCYRSVHLYYFIK